MTVEQRVELERLRGERALLCRLIDELACEVGIDPTGQHPADLVLRVRGWIIGEKAVLNYYR